MWVGVDDPEWGQIVVAAIAPCEPGAVGREAVGALKGAVRDRLGRAAAPKDIRIVRALPLRGVGKPDRQAVRRLFSAE
ncbi:hypothetical protein ACFQ2Y_44935 [Streptomyces malaysiensis subsp. malaysiensis]